MQKISLDGDWQLKHFLEGTLNVESPDRLDAVDAETIPARVPGNVELDLLRAGKIEDPFYGRNVFHLREYEFHQWWYGREFDVPARFKGRPCELVFHGLDCVATVWVNGVLVGESANMLVEQRFDVTGAIRPNETNRIDVRIRSPLNYARDKNYDAIVNSWEGREEALWVRKAAHTYGWDIAPRIVSAGIWRSVELVAHDADEIEDLYYYTSRISPEGATLVCHFKFKTGAPILDGFSLRFRGRCGRRGFSQTTPVEFVTGQVRIEISNPLLWWPKGYGDPNLYSVTCELLKDGKVLDKRVDRVGIRTVHLDRNDTVGEEGRFRFIVNGQPIMVKGANWVPLDAFHSRDAERVDDVVALFDDLGCNMIRCWGGNVYEDHKFFDLCDERGIMVWQDFAFACARYPQTDDFLSAVREEGRKIVRKLRNHASLALWCGDNEVDYGFYAENFLPEDNRLTREVLRRVVQSCDPHRPYVPSSPYAPPAISRTSTPQNTPEQHLWGPRDYFKSRFYVENTAHFIGEIGYHGCPNVSSIRKFIPEENLWPWDNEDWRAHSVEHWQYKRRSYDRNELMVNQVRELFGDVPETLEEFALASQIVQAEAKKFFIEHTRMRKWRCSGVLWWNVIDCWPQFSDAVVDYYFGKKLAYHYIKRVQRPVCVMVGEPDSWHLPVVVGNDSLEEAKGSYRVWDADTGETALEGDFRVGANENANLGRIRIFRGERRLFLIEWTLRDERCGNHYLCGSPPFSFDVYRQWLNAISALPYEFNSADVAR
ncbi:MAG: glycoside hydrolase family 2 protein [bacterium]